MSSISNGNGHGHGQGTGQGAENTSGHGSGSGIRTGHGSNHGTGSGNNNIKQTSLTGGFPKRPRGSSSPVTSNNRFSQPISSNLTAHEISRHISLNSLSGHKNKTESLLYSSDRSSSSSLAYSTTNRQALPSEHSLKSINIASANSNSAKKPPPALSPLECPPKLSNQIPSLHSSIGRHRSTPTLSLSSVPITPLSAKPYPSRFAETPKTEPSSSSSSATNSPVIFQKSENSSQQLNPNSPFFALPPPSQHRSSISTNFSENENETLPDDSVISYSPSSDIYATASHQQDQLSDLLSKFELDQKNQKNVTHNSNVTPKNTKHHTPDQLNISPISLTSTQQKSHLQTNSTSFRKKPFVSKSWNKSKVDLDFSLGASKKLHLNKSLSAFPANIRKRSSTSAYSPASFLSHKSSYSPNSPNGNTFFNDSNTQNNYKKDNTFFSKNMSKQRSDTSLNKLQFKFINNTKNQHTNNDFPISNDSNDNYTNKNNNENIDKNSNNNNNNNNIKNLFSGLHYNTSSASDASKDSNLKMKMRNVNLTPLSIPKSNTFSNTFSSNTSEEDIISGESPTWALGAMLQSLEDLSTPPELLIEHANDIVTLFRLHSNLRKDLQMSMFVYRIQTLLLSKFSNVIAAGYRVARYTITDIESLRFFLDIHIDYLVIHSLTKESKYKAEREQAIKFIRAFFSVKDGVKHISQGMIRTIISVAEHIDDKLRYIAIETLAELAILAPEQAAAADVYKTLLETIVDGPYELSDTLVFTITYILNKPNSRKFLKPDSDIEFLFLPFTEISVSNTKGGGHINSEKVHSCARVILALLKSWSGLFALCTYNFRPIKSLVSCLLDSVPFLRDTILDILFDVLGLQIASWSSQIKYSKASSLTKSYYDNFDIDDTTENHNDGYSDGLYASQSTIKTSNPSQTPVLQNQNGYNINNKSTSNKVKNKSSVLAPPSSQSLLDNHDILKHYRGLILAILIECDLIPILLKILETSDDKQNISRSSLLMGEIFKLASTSLPEKYAKKTQQLPELFSSAADLHSASKNRFQAASTIFKLDYAVKSVYKNSIPKPIRKYSMNQSTFNSSFSMLKSDQIANPIKDDNELTRPLTPPPKRLSNNSTTGNSHSPVQPSKLFSIQNIDDQSFRNLLAETNVLNTKNYLKWNWETLDELIQGPLMNSKRFEETMKATKFLKRLLSFYRPFKYRFSSIKSNKLNEKYIWVGCNLINTLLKSTEGIRYLSENKLIRQIAECLAQIDPMSGITSSEPLFSKLRLETTISHGYFTFLGVLSRNINGLAILERWKLFNMFYHISEVPEREDIIKYFISEMDYLNISHPRIILSKVLTTGTCSARLFATRQLQKIFKSLIFKHEGSNAANTTKLQKWIIRALVQQLYDPDKRVSELSVQILDEACSYVPENLKYIAECKPLLDYLGESAVPLLIRFLLSSVGFEYLKELNFINHQLENWYKNGVTESFVRRTELLLGDALFGFSLYSKDHFSMSDILMNSLKAAKRASQGSIHEHRRFGSTISTPTSGLLFAEENSSPKSMSDSDTFILPVHFYRELVRTKEGCDILRDRGHFDGFVSYLRENWREEEDNEIIEKVKGCLWTIGSVGSIGGGYIGYGFGYEESVCLPDTSTGWWFIEHSKVVKDIIEVARYSKVWSIKGTAFFTIGLLASTARGMEALEDFGWDTADGLGAMKGMCLPNNLKDFTGLGSWEYVSYEIKSLEEQESTKKQEHSQNSSTSGLNVSKPMKSTSINIEEDEIAKKILQCLSNLSNYVLANDASKELVKIETRHEAYFNNIEMFVAVMDLLGKYRYRLPVRRFILELFNSEKILRKFAA